MSEKLICANCGLPIHTFESRTGKKKDSYGSYYEHNNGYKTCLFANGHKEKNKWFDPFTGYAYIASPNKGDTTDGLTIPVENFNLAPWER